MGLRPVTLASGPLAQLVEQRVYTACVIGSSPVGSTFTRSALLARGGRAFSLVAALHCNCLQFLACILQWPGSFVGANLYSHFQLFAHVEVHEETRKSVGERHTGFEVCSRSRSISRDGGGVAGIRWPCRARDGGDVEGDGCRYVPGGSVLPEELGSGLRCQLA